MNIGIIARIKLYTDKNEKYWIKELDKNDVKIRYFSYKPTRI